MSKAKSIFKQAFKDVPNVYTQHTSHLSGLVEQLKKGQLKEQEYPSLNPGSQPFRVGEIVLFQLGGTTYEEAKEIGVRNIQAGFNEVLLGGTQVLNS